MLEEISYSFSPEKMYTTVVKEEIKMYKGKQTYRGNTAMGRQLIKNTFLDFLSLWSAL